MNLKSLEDIEVDFQIDDHFSNSQLIGDFLFAIGELNLSNFSVQVRTSIERILDIEKIPKYLTKIESFSLLGEVSSESEKT